MVSLENPSFTDCWQIPIRSGCDEASSDNSNGLQVKRAGWDASFVGMSVACLWTIPSASQARHLPLLRGGIENVGHLVH